MVVQTALYLNPPSEEHRKLCADMANSKGWSVAAEFCDTAPHPASSDSLVGRAELIKAAGDGDITALIIPSLNHLGRSAQQVINLLVQLDRLGLLLISCEEALDTGTPSGRFVIGMFASLAGLEKGSISLRSTGRAARGMRDGDTGGRLPMGYKRLFDERGEPAGIAIVESDAETVRYMFVLRSRGYTLAAIATQLNELGVATRRGKQWYASSIKVVLDNEGKYRGGLRGLSNARWPDLLGS